MVLAVQQQREAQCRRVVAYREAHGDDGAVKVAIDNWLSTYDDIDLNGEYADKLIAMLERQGDDAAKAILRHRDMLAKKTFWMFGGDGWAYDIGFGGLDHVVASGENVNVLVVDTEVYSNTGGQSSKATPTAAVAKFAASGKRTKKKDLGMMAKSYGYVYVAQVAMGADKNQFMKAVTEAEAYHGPSLIICYAPCINHGMKAGMGKAQASEKQAVECGYWSLYRYNPDVEAEGKNGFTLDSKKEPNGQFRDFIMGQVRYNSLLKEFPDIAEDLFAKTEKDAMDRWEGYKKLAERD
jgi:pyruvate-ferredoxin/flavodoxin oxidoreductase